LVDSKKPKKNKTDFCPVAKYLITGFYTNIPQPTPRKKEIRKMVSQKTGIAITGKWTGVK
jgi:hypothetical protein